MLYYLAVALMPYVSAMNVLTYQTVRAGGAALTGFLFCVLVGPWMIRMLRSLKAGQYIKKEHVAELHALHKGKAGTPTMGGTLIIFSTVLTLFFWGLLENRLLWLAVIVLVMLGVVGFLDDFIKMKRKHNDGLSARAKFTGQIITGLVLGVYLINNPITVGAAEIQVRDVLDWDRLVRSIAAGAGSGNDARLARLFARLDPQTQATVTAMAKGGAAAPEDRFILLRGLNAVLERPGLYDPAAWQAHGETADILKRDGDASERDTVRLNRLLVEDALPGAVASSVPNLHTKVGVPGLKDVFIPMGAFYILFVILIIVSVSNAVNVTDGLDGLATGASIISILAYAAIAYVVSRADWSSYLFVTYVPEATELFVFGAALLGTGLGFLWFNCHPAEVFMGDTGSLSLGGAIGTLAILTKQELLLPIVAGLFVLEAGSVVLQVASFKLTGKRIFRMSPLHHHFELGGWSETKVVMR
ncbi:MAG: phospho-N-acetylmuramoyl-pentapeptide-transferase, partial [Candidatus Hydrogenedentes bacterium]|nr:phospho-N-acetylmuramoyl-pentapeptide-transferase [Candidatus Hydrogenedentota bacterium]